MVLKSIHVSIPDTKPFERGDWFEAVVGHFIIPVTKMNGVESYWFTRYEEPNGNPRKHVRFRLRTDDYAPLKADIDDLIKNLGFTDLKDEEGYGEEFKSARWVGERNPPADPAQRQKLIWTFLTSAAALYVDTFSHQDSDGHWYREVNHDRAQNIDGETLESVHHLFCNMTAVQPRVEMMEQLMSNGLQAKLLIAGTYRRWSGLPDEVVRASQRVQF